MLDNSDFTTFLEVDARYFTPSFHGIYILFNVGVTADS